MMNRDIHGPSTIFIKVWKGHHLIKTINMANILIFSTCRVTEVRCCTLMLGLGISVIIPFWLVMLVNQLCMGSMGLTCAKWNDQD